MIIRNGAEGMDVQFGGKRMNSVWSGGKIVWPTWHETDFFTWANYWDPEGGWPKTKEAAIAEIRKPMQAVGIGGWHLEETNPNFIVSVEPTGDGFHASFVRDPAPDIPSPIPGVANVVSGRFKAPAGDRHISLDWNPGPLDYNAYGDHALRVKLVDAAMLSRPGPNRKNFMLQPLEQQATITLTNFFFNVSPRDATVAATLGGEHTYHALPSWPDRVCGALMQQRWNSTKRRYDYFPVAGSQPVRILGDSSFCLFEKKAGSELLAPTPRILQVSDEMHGYGFVNRYNLNFWFDWYWTFGDLYTITYFVTTEDGRFFIAFGARSVTVIEATDVYDEWGLEGFPRQPGSSYYGGASPPPGEVGTRSYHLNYAIPLKAWQDMQEDEEESED
jgi:hypothetical protein